MLPLDWLLRLPICSCFKLSKPLQLHFLTSSYTFRAARTNWAWQKKGSPRTIAGELLPASPRRAKDGKAFSDIRCEIMDQSAGQLVGPSRGLPAPAADGWLAFCHRTPNRIQLVARGPNQQALPG